MEYLKKTFRYSSLADLSSRGLLLREFWHAGGSGMFKQAQHAAGSMRFLLEHHRAAGLPNRRRPSSGRDPAEGDAARLRWRARGRGKPRKAVGVVDDGVWGKRARRLPGGAQARGAAIRMGVGWRMRKRGDGIWDLGGRGGGGAARRVW